MFASSNILKEVNAKLAVLEAAIAANGALITTNISDIATNTSDITTNAAAIAANAAAIAAAGFVDRGDPTSYDKIIGDFTRDGAWHDLDLISIVPAGAKLIILDLNFMSGTVGRDVKFRKKGNSNDFNVSRAYTQVTNKPVNCDVIVEPDANAVIQYNAHSDINSAFNLTVRGWFL